MTHEIYGLMAEFDEPESLVSTAHAVTQLGYRRLDAYSPFPVEGLAEALNFPKTAVPFLALGGGLIGGVSGYLLQWYAAAVSYPLDVGRRPLNSWPAFVPIVFELTILGAALATVFGMFFLNELPKPYHPVFNAESFQLASRDRFFLCIEASDPSFDLAKTRSLLESFHPLKIMEVML